MIFLTPFNLLNSLYRQTRSISIMLFHKYSGCFWLNMHKRSVIMTDSNAFSLFPIIYSNSVNLGLPLADISFTVYFVISMTCHWQLLPNVWRSKKAAIQRNFFVRMAASGYPFYINYFTNSFTFA